MNLAGEMQKCMLNVAGDVTGYAGIRSYYGDSSVSEFTGPSDVTGLYGQIVDFAATATVGGNVTFYVNGVAIGTTGSLTTISTSDATAQIVVNQGIDATSRSPNTSVNMINRSRGRDYADLLIMSPEHYSAYDAATIAIQRQTNETSLGKLGFTALEYIGGGKRAEIVLDGGIGSNMPANTTFGINTDTLRLRYNSNRNFDKLFTGDGQMPIDKDAIAQFIGWMGELTMTNPLFNWRMYDSNPAT